MQDKKTKNVGKNSVRNSSTFENLQKAYDMIFELPLYF